MAKNADLFRKSTDEQAAVQENMTQAILKLSADQKEAARQAMARTADSMKDLEKAVNKQLEAQQMEQAYKLKKSSTKIRNSFPRSRPSREACRASR